MKRRDFIVSCASIAGLASLYEARNIFKNNDNIKDSLEYIEISICDYCNLNCKYCRHFSCIADKVFYDLKQYKQDIKQLAKITKGNIKKIRIMGGEPLLNPNVSDYLRIARRHFPNTRIYLVTNGILLNQQDESFWYAVRDNNIIMRLSFYKVNINWKSIFAKFEKYNIQVSEKYGHILIDAKKPYIETFRKSNLDLTGSQTDLTFCKKCEISGCINLLDGKLYACPIISNIRHFNKRFNQNLEVSKGDYIDIYKISSTDDIINWKNSPKKFCRYCTEAIDMPWESSSEHSIKEWINEA